MGRVGGLRTELDAATERVRSAEALLESVEAERDALEQRAAELSASLDAALRQARSGATKGAPSCAARASQASRLSLQGDELLADKAKAEATVEDLRFGAVAPPSLRHAALTRHVFFSLTEPPWPHASTPRHPSTAKSPPGLLSGQSCGGDSTTQRPAQRPLLRR